MDLKRRIDTNNINSFLPDNLTIGTSEYYKNKFNGTMPDYICEYLEVKSREEYNDEKEIEQIIEEIKKKEREENLKIIQEYDEIVKESQENFITPLIHNLDLEDISN